MKRTVGIMFRTFTIPGRKGMQVDPFVLITGATKEEGHAVATASLGKARGATVQDSEEFPGCVEICGLSANSIADSVAHAAALGLSGLNEKDALAQGQPANGGGTGL